VFVLISIATQLIFHLFQDFVCDLLIMLDTFLPLKKVMEGVQSFSTPAWKCGIYMSRLCKHYESMDFQTRFNMPLLAEHIEDIQQMKFKGKGKFTHHS